MTSTVEQPREPARPSLRGRGPPDSPPGSHAPAPDDYLHAGQPAVVRPRAARAASSKVDPRDRGRRHPGHPPGWGWSLRPPARPVRRDRRRRSTAAGTGAPTPDLAARARAADIAITVKAMPEGFLSEHLVRGLEPGTIVRLAAPQGDFVLPDPPPAKMLFLTAGSGITPVDGDAAHARPPRHHARRRPRALRPRRRRVLFRAELQSSPSSTGPRAARAAHRRRRPCSARPARAVCPTGASARPGPAGRRRCSTPPRSSWEQAGDRDAAAPRALLRSSSTAPAARAAPSPSTQAASAVDVDGATTLLEAGEAVGVQMPFGCRMGICHTCVLPARLGHRPRPAQRQRDSGTSQRARSRPASPPPPATACSTSEPAHQPARPHDRRSSHGHQRHQAYAHLTEDDVEALGASSTSSAPRSRRVAGDGRRRRTSGGSSRIQRRLAAAGRRDAVRQPVPAGLGGRHRHARRRPRSWRTWRSATTSCTASGTG